MKARSHTAPFAWRVRLVTLAVASCFAPPTAYANPVGPTVTNGSATVSTRGNLLTIRNTPGAIINWRSFSIARGETTRFDQNSAASIVLNRVVGADPSSILGRLQSNGQVVLLNPNGIAFGAGARIDTAGFIASTLTLSDEDFLERRFRFTDGLGKGSIVNDGVIRTRHGGEVWLIAPEVENNGVIRAPGGEVMLAAGHTVHLVDSSRPEILVELSAPEASAVNVGKIVADSGQIGIYGGVVRNSGAVSANTAVVGENGKIVFRAVKDVTLGASGEVSARGGSVTVQSETGTTMVSGKVDVSSDRGEGGSVQLLGDRVGLVGADVDASGRDGGGTVLVGGDFQGANAEVQNAKRTYVSADSTIRADGGASGDGGKVIVWADEVTRFRGSISARGGATGGDGGFVEVSGKDTLEFAGKVDISAPRGQAGTLLLDPTNINVVADATNALDDELTPPGDASILFADAPGDTDLSVSELTAFSSGTVVLQATSDITFGVDTTLQTDVSLVAQAGNDIRVNTGVTLQAQGSGSLHLEADSPHNGSPGTGTLRINGTVQTDSGDITLISDGFVIDPAASITSTSGNVNIARSTAVALGLGTGGTVLSDAELDTISTGGVLRIGAATTAGSDGRGTAAQNLLAASIDIQGQVVSLTNVGRLKLSAAGAITDSGAGALTVSELALQAGSVTLNSASNNVTTIAASVTGAGNGATFVDADGVTVGTVDGVSGIHTADNGAGNTGAISVTAGAGELLVSQSVTTGNATGGDSGSITLTGGAAVTIDAAVSTGTASKDGTGVSASASSGSVTIAANGGDLRGTGTVSSGNATISNPADADDTASVGNIDLTATSISEDGTAPFRVSFGTPDSGGTDNPGLLTATTDGAGDAGHIRVRSLSNLSVDVLATDAGSSNPVQITVDAGNTLTIAGDSDLDTDAVKLRADRMVIDPGTIDADAITLDTTTSGRAIDLGSAVDTNAALELSNAELGNLTANNTLTIGSGTAGAVSVTDAIDVSGSATDLAVQSGSNIAFGSAGSLTADAVVTLTAGDAVVGNNNATTNVTATDVVISAANGIGAANTLSVDATNLAASNSTDGAIDITDVAGGVSVGVNGAGVSQTGNGTVDISATGGTLAVTESVSSTGTGTITLAATGATSDVTVADGKTVSSNGGNIVINADNDINLNSTGTVATSGTGTIGLTADADTDNAGAISAGTGAIQAGSGLVSLSAATGISAGTTVDNLTATNSTSGDIAITDTAGGLTIAGGGVSQTGNGTVDITATDGTLAVDQSVSSTGDGTITLSATGTASGVTVAATKTVSSNGGDIAVNADNDINVSGTVVTSGTGTVTLTADADTSGAGLISAAAASTIQAGTGLVSLSAATGIDAGTQADTVSAVNSTSGDVVIADADSLSISGSNTGGGKFDVTATAGGSTLTVDAGNINANSGNVILAADEITLTGTVSGNDVTLKPQTATTAITLGAGTGGLNFIDADLDKVTATGVLTVGSAASGDITVDAPISQADSGYTTLALVTGGAIVDANDTDPDLTVTNLALDAATGIGNGTTLETAVSKLAFRNATSGAVDIANTGGLTIDSVAGIATSSNNGASSTTTSLSASSPITFNVNTTSKGDLTASAADAAGGGDDITVASGVTLESTAGAVILHAGDNVVLQSGSTVTAATAVTLDAGVTNAVDGLGALNLGGGTVNATTAINLAAQEDITLGLLSLPGQTITVTSNGAIIDGNGVTNNINAASAVLSAATGIGSGDAIETTVTSLSADSTDGDVAVANASAGNLTVASLTTGGTGTITFDQTGGGAASFQTVTTNDGTVDLEVTNANLTVDNPGVTAGGAGNVLLSTTGSGNVVLTGTTTADASTVTITSAGNISGAGTVTGATVVLDSATGVGVSAADRVNTSADTLAARSRSSGGVFVAETDGVTLDTVGGVANGAAAGGAYDLTSGELTVTGPVSTTGTVTLKATGSINGGGLISAGTADLDATTGIGNATALNLAAANISADSVAGNIDLNNNLAGPVTVASLTTGGTGTITFDQTGGGAASFTAVSTNDGTVDLEVAGANLTVGGSVNAGGAGNVLLTTTGSGNVVLTGTTTADASTVTITSAGNISGAGTVTGATVVLDSATGVGVSAADRVNTSADTLAARSRTSGGVFVAETDGVTLNTVNTVANSAAGGANYDLSAGGDITVTGPVSSTGTTLLTSGGKITGAGTVSGSNVVLDSATGVGVSAVNRLATSAGTLAARSRSSGGVFIAETDALTLNDVGGVGNTTAADGAYDLSAGGTLTLTGAVSADGTGAVTLSANGTGSDIVSGAGGTVLSGSGQITLSAADQVTVGGAVGASGTSTIAITANADGGAGGALGAGESGLLSSTAAIGNAASGAVVLRGNAVTLNAGVNTASSAQVTALTGAISGTGTISAAQAVLTAGTAIGAGAGSRLNTAVGILEARANNGGVFIAESDALTIGGASLGTLTTGVSANGGDVDVSTGGALTVNEAVAASAGRTVKLASAGDMTVNAAVTGTGGVELQVNAADATLTHTAGAINAGPADALLLADRMNLAGGTVSAGNIRVDSFNAGHAIDLGSSADSAASTLELSSSELNTLSTAGVLTIGDENHTGLIRISDAVTLTTPTGTVRVVNRQGGIDVNDTLQYLGGDLEVVANGGGATVGAIRDDGTGKLRAGGGHRLTLEAASGIGATGQPLHVDLVGSTTTLAASNSTSGEIVIETDGNVLLADTFRNDGGTIHLSTVDGGINTGNAVVHGTGSVTLQANDIGTASAAGITVGSGGVTSSGDVTLRAADDVVINGNVDATGGSGNVAIVAGVADGMTHVNPGLVTATDDTRGLSGVFINARVLTGGGDIEINATGPVRQAGRSVVAGLQTGDATGPLGALRVQTYNDAGSEIFLENDRAVTGNRAGELLLEARRAGAVDAPPFARGEISYKSINGTTIKAIGTASVVTLEAPSHIIDPAATIAAGSLTLLATAGDITVDAVIPNAFINEGLTGGTLSLLATENINIGPGGGIGVGEARDERFDHDVVLNAGGTINVRGSIFLTGDLALRADADSTELGDKGIASDGVGGVNIEVTGNTPVAVRARSIVVGAEGLDGGPRAVEFLTLKAGTAASGEDASAILQSDTRAAIYTAQDVELTAGNAASGTGTPRVRTSAQASISGTDVLIRAGRDVKLTAGTAEVTSSGTGTGAADASAIILASATKTERGVGVLDIRAERNVEVRGGTVPTTSIGGASAFAILDPGDMTITAGESVALIGGTGRNSGAAILSAGNIRIITGVAPGPTPRFNTTDRGLFRRDGTTPLSPDGTLPGGLLLLGGAGTGIFDVNGDPLAGTEPPIEVVGTITRRAGVFNSAGTRLSFARVASTVPTGAAPEDIRAAIEAAIQRATDTDIKIAENGGEEVTGVPACR